MDEYIIKSKYLIKKEEKSEAWIDDRTEEHILNLVAQGYYGEVWEFITRLTDQFNAGLYSIAAIAMNLKRSDSSLDITS
jgi:hypothetical protein